MSMIWEHIVHFGQVDGWMVELAALTLLTVIQFWACNWCTIVGLTMVLHCSGKVERIIIMNNICAFTCSKNVPQCVYVQGHVGTTLIIPPPTSIFTANYHYPLVDAYRTSQQPRYTAPLDITSNSISPTTSVYANHDIPLKFPMAVTVIFFTKAFWLDRYFSPGKRIHAWATSLDNNNNAQTKFRFFCLKCWDFQVAGAVVSYFGVGALHGTVFCRNRGIHAFSDN